MLPPLPVVIRLPVTTLPVTDVFPVYNVEGLG